MPKRGKTSELLTLVTEFKSCLDSGSNSDTVLTSFQSSDKDSIESLSNILVLLMVSRIRSTDGIKVCGKFFRNSSSNSPEMQSFDKAENANSSSSSFSVRIIGCFISKLDIDPSSFRTLTIPSRPTVAFLTHLFSQILFFN